MTSLEVTNVQSPLLKPLPIGIVLDPFNLRLMVIVPPAASPSSLVPVAVNSTLASCFSETTIDLSTPLVTSVSVSFRKETEVSTVWLLVFADIITVALGANLIAHTKKAIKRISSEPKISNFFLNLLKFGTFCVFLGRRGDSPLDGGVASLSLAIAAATAESATLLFGFAAASC